MNYHPPYSHLSLRLLRFALCGVQSCCLSCSRMCQLSHCHMAECVDPQVMNTGYQELVNSIMGRVCQSKLVNIGKEEYG